MSTSSLCTPVLPPSTVHVCSGDEADDIVVSSSTIVMDRKIPLVGKRERLPLPSLPVYFDLAYSLLSMAI